MSTSPTAQYSVSIRHNLECHPLTALIACVCAYFQLSSHKQLGALLDVRHAFCQLAKAADRKEDRLPIAVPNRQTEVTVLFAALLGLLEFSVLSGIADEKDVDFLIVQMSSPPHVQRSTPALLLQC